MELTKVFRCLLVTWVAILVIQSGVGLAELEAELELGWGFTLVFLFGLLTLFSIPVILLFLLKPIGKPLFILLTIITTLGALAVTEEEPISGLEDFLNILLAMTDGAILMMLFFTPLKDTFRWKKTQ